MLSERQLHGLSGGVMYGDLLTTTLANTLYALIARRFSRGLFGSVPRASRDPMFQLQLQLRLRQSPAIADRDQAGSA
jgi:hypothetical protein